MLGTFFGNFILKGQKLQKLERLGTKIVIKPNKLTLLKRQSEHKET